MIEEGKEGDKLQECSETTGPLFLLKELLRHSASMGGLQVLLHKEGSERTWPADSNGTRQAGSLQTVSRATRNHGRHGVRVDSTRCDKRTKMRKQSELKK